MRIYHEISNHLHFSHPLDLCLGFFDGVHLGHQSLLKHANTVITFSNPPKALFTGRDPELIQTLSHRLDTLKQCDIQTLFLLPFTQEFAAQSAHTFVSKLATTLPIRSFSLGYDTCMGHAREQGPETLAKLFHDAKIPTQIHPPVFMDQQPISSQRVRKAIEMGDLSTIEKLLGRRYAIEGAVCTGSQIGRQHGIPTINISLESLCLLPFGVYRIECWIEQKKYPGIANLGFAPTCKQTQHPQLEVHLLHPFSSPIEKLTTEFLEFIRPERKFASPQALYQQIQRDIEYVLDLFGHGAKLQEPCGKVDL